MTGSRTQIDPARIEAALARFARIGDTGDGGVERVSFSREDRLAREGLRAWWQENGLEASVDEAGNMFGLRRGIEDLPPIMLGSHLDSVPAGGRFDGTLGVVVATEVIQALQRAGVRTRHPLTAVNFSAEEPSPFGPSTIGSRAFSGRLQPEELSLTDETGRTLAKAIDDIGGNSAALGRARRHRGDIAAFLELHIEQGRTLFDEGHPVGVVTHIAGIRRLHVELTGEANHAGTTRMVHRRDALAAAAEIVLAVEQLALSFGDPVVGTVGRLHTAPNASNVVPGSVHLTAEFRHIDARALDEVTAEARRHITAVVARRGLKARVADITDIAPVPLDEHIVELLGGVCQKVTGTDVRLPSMAGHDAAHVAAIAPTGMIFVASKEGKSHTPEEWSDPEAIALGAQVMLEAVLALDELLAKGRTSG